MRLMTTETKEPNSIQALPSSKKYDHFHSQIFIFIFCFPHFPGYQTRLKKILPASGGEGTGNTEEDDLLSGSEGVH